MATITITIPDAKLDALIDGFVYQHKYTDTVKDSGGNDIPNPVSKPAYAKGVLREFIRQSYKAWKIKELQYIKQNAITTADNYTDDMTVT